MESTRSQCREVTGNGSTENSNPQPSKFREVSSIKFQGATLALRRFGAWLLNFPECCLLKFGASGGNSKTQRSKFREIANIMLHNAAAIRRLIVEVLLKFGC